MKSIYKLITVSALSVPALVACGNQTVFDTVYTFNYAQVKLPDGTIKEGKVKEWSDYSDGDQLQIKFDDGHTILVHSSNTVLSVKVIE